DAVDAVERRQPDTVLALSRHTFHAYERRARGVERTAVGAVLAGDRDDALVEARTGVDAAAEDAILVGEAAGSGDAGEADRRRARRHPLVHRAGKVRRTAQVGVAERNADVRELRPVVVVLREAGLAILAVRRAGLAGGLHALEVIGLERQRA